MRYDYHMVQIPELVFAKTPGGMRTAAAENLQKTVNQYARQNWEFYRLDAIGVHLPAGCLASLLGQSGRTVYYNVITFRRAVT